MCAGSVSAGDRFNMARPVAAAHLEGSEADVAGAWDSEIERMADDLASGRVAGVPAADVFAEVERRLRG